MIWDSKIILTDWVFHPERGTFMVDTIRDGIVFNIPKTVHDEWFGIPIDKCTKLHSTSFNNLYQYLFSIKFYTL